MAYQKWSPKELSYVLKCFNESHTIDEAILKIQLKYPNRSREKTLDKLSREGYSTGQILKTVQIKSQLSDVVIPSSLEESLAIKKLQNQIAILKSEISTLEHEVLVGDKLREVIHGFDQNKFTNIPKWVTKKEKTDHLTGTPVLFLSDIHFDEVVDAKQIGFVNSYDRPTAIRRLEYAFKSCVRLSKYYMSNPKYDGAVLMLGGDLLSGNIHEELAETNEARILDSILKLTEVLAAGIQLMVEEFGNIFIPCVVGNHGRIHRKPRYKYRVQDNYEWLVYNFLANKFSGDKRISFLIPDSPDAQFPIYNTRFLLTHGDQFRGGSGISGIFAPLFIGQARKQRNYQAIKSGFDIMAIGHFHQYIHTNSLIVNGCVKGFDEYAYGNNFAYEPAQQAMFIVHPTLGVTYRMPIILD